MGISSRDLELHLRDCTNDQLITLHHKVRAEAVRRMEMLDPLTIAPVATPTSKLGGVTAINFDERQGN